MYYIIIQYFTLYKHHSQVGTSILSEHTHTIDTYAKVYYYTTPCTPYTHAHISHTHIHNTHYTPHYSPDAR